MTTPARVVVVVLAGGESRRFGSDKLVAPVAGSSLLEHAMVGLPESAPVVVVGPERPLRRVARFVREDPPGGGPAAAMVAGLRAALDLDADEILVLPGDAPGAGSAAVLLRQVLAETAAAAVVGTDAAGFVQPLQLALRRSAAEQLLAAAGPDGASGGSARALVNQLEPAAVRWPLPAPASFDIDTREQLAAWTACTSPAAQAVLAAVDHLGPDHSPVVVALDGFSGSGKSTLAAGLSLARPVTLLHGDDFYSAELAGLDFFQRERLVDAEVAARAFDWRRLRDEALGPLSRSEPARFRPYDWVAGNGRLGAEVEVIPGALVVLDGVYSARPELADLVNLSVYVDVDDELRRRRLGARPDDPRLVGFWERGESYYFAVTRPVDTFDLVVTSVEE